MGSDWSKWYYRQPSSCTRSNHHPEVRLLKWYQEQPFSYYHVVPKATDRRCCEAGIEDIPDKPGTSRGERTPGAAKPGLERTGRECREKTPGVDGPPGLGAVRKAEAAPVLNVKLMRISTRREIGGHAQRVRIRHRSLRLVVSPTGAGAYRPQQFLYLRPERHGHGSLRPSGGAGEAPSSPHQVQSASL